MTLNYLKFSLKQRYFMKSDGAPFEKGESVTNDENPFIREVIKGGHNLSLNVSLTNLLL